MKRHKIPLLIILFVLATIAAVSIKYIIQQNEDTVFISDSGTLPATLAQYWTGEAEWKFEQKLTQSNAQSWEMNATPRSIIGFEAGVHMMVVNNETYMISRTAYPGTSCGNAGVQIGIVIRKYQESSGIWSSPVELVVPNGDNISGCIATDGDLYYDRPSDTWHLLYQCLGTNFGWSGCYATRKGSDPMGRFTLSTQNPVIKPGDLWSKICKNRQGNVCYKLTKGKVAEEGTFDIIDKIDNWYYIAFHGFDATPGKHYGLRGIAKTRNFIDFVAGDSKQNVPTDAILTLQDAANWRETWQGTGNIGFGAGSTLKEGNFYYMLAESADLSLTCTPGQNWDIGIFRTRSLASNTWNQPNNFKNPILYSQKDIEPGATKSQPCNPAYTGFFKNKDGEIYMYSTRISTDPQFYGIYLYKLVTKTNLLTNADFVKCNGTSWTRFNDKNIASVQFGVHRLLKESTDGNCVAKINCISSACVSGQSVYQDITLQNNTKPKNIKFGGKIRQSTNNGLVELVLFELAANGSIVKPHKLTINMQNNEWQILDSERITLDKATRILRLQVYVLGNNQFSMDEMYVIPAE